MQQNRDVHRGISFEMLPKKLIHFGDLVRNVREYSIAVLSLSPMLMMFGHDGRTNILCENEDCLRVRTYKNDGKSEYTIFFNFSLCGEVAGRHSRECTDLGLIPASLPVSSSPF